MKVEKSKTLKTALVFAAFLAVVIVVLLLMNIPAERQQETKVETLEMNSYDPAEVNGSDLRETITSSVLVRSYIEENRLPSLWASVETEKDINVLIVYNIPELDALWKRLGYEMPGDARPLYIPDLIVFTEDAMREGACVANVTRVQGDIVVCVGIDKEAAINAIKEYATRMECGTENAYCATNAIEDALRGGTDTTMILYVGTNGRVLKIYEPERDVLTFWYGGAVSKYFLGAR